MAANSLYTKLHAMFAPLQKWAEKADLMVPAMQVVALIVCHAPIPQWQAHMDVTKEGKKIDKAKLLGSKKEGLLRLLLTDLAYEDKSSRAALLGLLRLLVGGYPLPSTLLGKHADAEWWIDQTEAQVS